ncbi:MAG: MBL fold metallo-hydrolase [Solirubrobacteraceae bacterium]|jgi:glyoxylase-like metal-dependent hydrolase (beta-lactamase superfamily II)
MSRDLLRPLDVRHLGHARVICAWLVGDVLVDPGPSSSLPALLEGLAGVRPRALALTHIHLDHAGGAGTLVARWPELEVWVHERGAPHLVDPERLLASATRLYGDEMERLWGEVLPVPEANIHALHGGEQIGPFEVAYTPGHASHHVSYWHADTRTAFVGDVAGVRIEPLHYILAPTVPPDIDIERWHASIDVIRAWRPERLALTHFGVAADPDAHLDTLDMQLDRWAARARELEREQFGSELLADIEQHCGKAGATLYHLGAALDYIYDGLARYWSKRDAQATA